MPIEKQYPLTLEKLIPPTLEIGSAGMLPPPTEVPGVPTFTLTALSAAIGLRITRPATGGRAQGYRYRVRRRNAADTAWESAQAWVDLGTRRSTTITQYSAMQAIEVGRRYQVKAIAYNVFGNGTETAYQEVKVINVPSRPGLFLTAQAGGFDVRVVEQPSGDPSESTFFRYREGRSGDWTHGLDLKVRNLKGNTLYQVEAWLANDAGRSLSVTRTVTTLAATRLRGQLAVYGDNLAVYGDNLKVYGA